MKAPSITVCIVFFALFYLSACDTVDTGPPASAQKDGVLSNGPNVMKSTASKTGESIFVPNTVKYSDTGRKPATGRAGSATITARALFDKDGQTLLEITTGELDTDDIPPGNLDKLQIKLFDPENAKKVLWTQNENGLKNGGYAAYTYGDMSRDMTVQVQANVSGIDRRVGVVTLQESVKLRPDLQVADLSAPDEADVDAPVTVSATIQELNGDVGARANCVLYADGQEADRSDGIWVDAGGTVSCAFATSFSSAGTKTLRAALEEVAPGDWDASNNSEETTIEIKQPRQVEWYLAHFSDRRDWSLNHAWTSETEYSDGSWFKDEGTWEEGGNFQYASLSFALPEALDFPLNRISVSEHTDGSQVMEHVYEDAESYSYGLYEAFWASFESTVGRIWMQIYSYGHDDRTYGWYHRFAGDVTYFSKSSGTYFEYDASTGSEYSWSWNYSDSGSHQLVDPGSSYGLSFEIEDESGSYTIDPTFTLRTYEANWDFPWNCWTYSGTDWQGRSYETTYCDESHTSGMATDGYADQWSNPL